MAPPDDDDFIERALEAQEHRYDPGYWTGGRVHPMYRASRPNKLGYLLLLFGALIVIAIAVSWDNSVASAVWLAVGALELAAGVRLLRGRRRRSHDHR